MKWLTIPRPHLLRTAKQARCDWVKRFAERCKNLTGLTKTRGGKLGLAANDEAAQLRRASLSCCCPWAESAVAAAWRGGLSWRLGNYQPTATRPPPCSIG